MFSISFCVFLVIFNYFFGEFIFYLLLTLVHKATQRRRRNIWRYRDSQAERLSRSSHSRPNNLKENNDAASASSNFFSLLQLPPEIVLNIADELDLASQVFLAQTCRSLRHLLSEETDIEYRAWLALHEMDFGDRLQFQAMAAYDLPDWWYCDICAELHPALAQDVPCAHEFSERTGLVEFYPWIHKIYYSLYRYDEIILPQTVKLYHVRHRHVQLALKYDRMQNEEQERKKRGLERYSYFDWYHRYYLWRIMRPKYAGTYVGYWRKLLCFSYPVSIRCEFRPKIVKGPDGRPRFLLRSIIPFDPPKGIKASSYKTLHRYLCRHHSIDYGSEAMGTEIDPEKERPVPSFWPYYHIETVQRQISEKEKKEGGLATKTSTWIYSSCSQCPMDSVLRDGQWYIYQDFGTEGFPPDDSWIEYLEKTYVWSIYRNDEVNITTYAVHHEPGSILAMYQDEEGNKQTLEMPKRE